MSTAEITAYLWGYRQASGLHNVNAGDGSFDEWLHEPSEPEYTEAMLALGLPRFLQWTTRGVQDWNLEHGQR